MDLNQGLRQNQKLIGFDRPRSKHIRIEIAASKFHTPADFSQKSAGMHSRVTDAKLEMRISKDYLT